jgi:hypothetical protein
MMSRNFLNSTVFRFSARAPFIGSVGTKKERVVSRALHTTTYTYTHINIVSLRGLHFGNSTPHLLFSYRGANCDNKLNVRCGIHFRCETLVSGTVTRMDRTLLAPTQQLLCVRTRIQRRRYERAKVWWYKDESHMSSDFSLFSFSCHPNHINSIVILVMSLKVCSSP